VIKTESDTEREKTVRFVRESMSNRLNGERSAIVVIMQRDHRVVSRLNLPDGNLNHEAARFASRN
jgi:hypothetical protein